MPVMNECVSDRWGTAAIGQIRQCGCDTASDSSVRQEPAKCHLATVSASCKPVDATSGSIYFTRKR